MDVSDTLKRLPAVDQVMECLDSADCRTRTGREALTDCVRQTVADLRDRIRSGERIAPGALAPEAIGLQALKRMERLQAGSLRSVINLTGVVIHTNLGRSPLSRAVLDDVDERLSTYNNLEYDLSAHERGSRHDHVAALLLQLIPAQAALVVNNNAAAVLLILAEFAAGREVVVSRGELIEIGGGFRIPDVMTQSGARLVEVGTTNRTRLEDYEVAVGPDTAMIFKAHPSNFRMVGFTEEAGYPELADLARRNGLVLTADLGSGRLADLGPRAGADDPSPTEVLEAGVDLVCFSGDKLLGGPQAGLIAGRADLIDSLRRNPLLRALRVDRFTIAALEATLRRYLDGRLDEVPVPAAIRAEPDAVRKRCVNLVRRVRRIRSGDDLHLRVVPTEAEVGGGTMPGRTIPSFGVEVRLKGRSETFIERSLRENEYAIIGRVHGGRLILDLRTLLEGQDELVARALAGLKAGEDDHE